MAPCDVYAIVQVQGCNAEKTRQLNNQNIRIENPCRKPLQNAMAMRVGA